MGDGVFALSRLERNKDLVQAASLWRVCREQFEISGARDPNQNHSRVKLLDYFVCMVLANPIFDFFPNTHRHLAAVVRFTLRH
jgi:hypothetical protein